VINLSYWVFPAFARLPLVAPDVDWAELSRNGLALIKLSQFGPARLPAEWVSLHGQEPKPADGFVKSFSYNAIRIPLYVAWAGLGQRDLYSPFLAVWQTLRNGGLPVIDTVTGQPVEWFADKGYTAISSLSSCAADHTPFSAESREIQANESYYSVTLNLLALVAGHMRYSSCLDR
jgi:endoglucanase